MDRGVIQSWKIGGPGSVEGGREAPGRGGRGREFDEEPPKTAGYDFWVGKSLLEVKAVAENADLASDLSAAAHLIHGSSEGRFRIVWCPGGLTQSEVEGVGFAYGQLDRMLELYQPEKRNAGYNRVAGEDFFYIANPGLGLWAHPSRLGEGNHGEHSEKAG